LSPKPVAGENGEGMSGIRNLYLAVVVLAMANLGRAQTVPLSETLHAGDCFRIHIEMSLDGELKINRESKRVPLKLEASGSHEFSERILSVNSDGLADKTARVYETAKADISINHDHSERTLRADRRLTVA
jgi:hypothetical protein